MQQYNVIGLMSGSSLDGVDLCYAEFVQENDSWKYKNCFTETIPYTEYWKALLRNLENETAEKFCMSHVHYGHYLGELIKSFIKKNNLKPDLISSHGHTVFHQPQSKFTTQAGDGASIYAVTGIKTVSDFRNVDVALGGQGAPLVPVGERDLFEDYGMFLNLGGIANISIFDKENNISAYDITPCNLPLNILCEKYFRVAYDENGSLASHGKLNQELLDELNNLNYFKEDPPKSLGREFILKKYLPLVESFNISAEDKLFTISQHITNELSRAISKHFQFSRKQNVLATGGGVYNKFLIDLLQEKVGSLVRRRNDGELLNRSPIAIGKKVGAIDIIIPPSTIIEYKEALIFGYLGILRVTNKVNSLSSVTNARRDSIGGAVWG